MSLRSPEVGAQLNAQVNRMIEQGILRPVANRLVLPHQVVPLAPMIRVCGAFFPVNSRTGYRLQVRELRRFADPTSRSL